MICSVLFCKFHLRTMHRCSSEKKGQSSLTRDHMVRRNSKALFRNSATECSTFTMHCNDAHDFHDNDADHGGDVKGVHPLHLDDGDFDFSDDHLLIIMIIEMMMMSKVDLLKTILVPDQQGVLWHSCLNLQYPTYFWRSLSNVWFLKMSRPFSQKTCSSNVL